MKFEIILSDSDCITAPELGDSLIRLMVDEEGYDSVIDLVGLVPDNPGVYIAVKAVRDETD